MAEQAKITSLDALERFRADLIVFITNAHRCVDEAGDEVRRTRQWLQGEQRMHWEGEARRRKRVLDQADADLYSARLSGLKDRTIVQEEAVRKAKRAMTEAEDKLRVLKKWNRDFDNCADPLVKRLEGKFASSRFAKARARSTPPASGDTTTRSLTFTFCFVM